MGGAFALLGRWAVGSGVACGLTLGSLVLVSWMNEDASPHQHETEDALPHTVAVVPPPPEPEPSDLAPELSARPAPTAAAAPPPIAPPAPAPPSVAGLAPSLGPGSLRITAGGGLPSMGTLPGSDIPAEVSTPVETPARARSRPAPRYPALARRRGIEGFVTLRLRVSARGLVSDAVVVSSEPPGVFDDAALGVVRRYRFEPARRAGERVATTLQQTIRFELQR